jgi:hypothetical protein
MEAEQKNLKNLPPLQENSLFRRANWVWWGEHLLKRSPWMEGTIETMEERPQSHFKDLPGCPSHLSPRVGSWGKVSREAPT